MTDSSVTTQILVDTNIFVYAADPAAGDKNALAFEIIQDLTSRKQLVVSVQVLNEFYQATTRPNKPPSLSHDEASRMIRDLTAFVPILPLTAAITLRALDAVPTHGFSFWDALIWAAAKENGIPVVYTEDFGLVQARVTLGDAKPAASWPESIVLKWFASPRARPCLEKVLPWLQAI